MARTFRRKQYTPYYVTTDYCFSPHLKCCQQIKLQGLARRKAINEWRSDAYFVSTPGPFFRKIEEHKNRINTKRELHKFIKDQDYAVSIINHKLPYWD